MDEQLSFAVIRHLCAQRAQHDAHTQTLIGQAIATGAKSADIAQALGISRATLWRRYVDELRRDPD